MWLYKITHTKTGKAYIGATITAVSRRINRHLQNAKNGKKSLIAGAIRKYGLAAFTVEILARARSKRQLANMEIAAIREHRTLAPDGYNRTIGGEKYGTRRGFHLSEEHRQKLRQAHLGMKASAETCRRISEGKRGRTHASISKEARKKIASSLMGHTVSEETRRKISASLKARKGETQIETPI